jgi:transcriptional regulator with XRE-family HTH domain
LRFGLDHPIRRARHRAQLTQRELAHRARVHFSRISQLENGLTARPYELERLAGVLGCTAADLRTAASSPAPVDIEASAHV